MKINKEFDAVIMMREIRDKLSEKMLHMTVLEQRTFIQERVGDELERLRKQRLSEENAA